MPNWCSNTVVYYSENKWNVYNLVNAIKKSRANKHLHYLEEELGIECIDDRGFIGWVSEVGHACSYYYVKIDIDSAWGPLDTLFHKIADVTHTKCVYSAEEPGSELYINTDEHGIFLSDRYKIDDKETFGSDYFEYIWELIHYCNDVYNANISISIVFEENYLEELTRLASEAAGHEVRIYEFASEY